LRGDFTPFHPPVVRFDELVLPGGAVQPMATDRAKDGVPILRLSPPPGQKKGSFISREIAQGKQSVKDAVAQFTAPGRGDRLVQFIYTQLPYHPERIETATAWTVELAQPLDLTVKNDPPEDGTDPLVHEESQQRVNAKLDATKTRSDQNIEWRLRAYLQQTISSA